MNWRRWLAVSVYDPLFWRLYKRLPIFDRLAELRTEQWEDRTTAERRQLERLGALLEHAIKRVDYYRAQELHLSPSDVRSDPLSALARFPVLERCDLTRNLDELTVEMGLGTFTNSSGGSTGIPVQLRQDRAYLAATLASMQLAYEWAGVARGESHVRLWGARRDIDTGHLPLSRRASDFCRNRVTLDAFRMQRYQLEEYLSVIRRMRPVCLEGYADALYELSDHIAESGVPIAAPRSIVASASTLLPYMRERIEQVIGAPVYDRYGSREAGTIAAECGCHSGLHVMGATTVVEVVDEDGRAVGVGEEGDILVTNLCNFTMPLIRYRIGDRAVRGEDRCCCGRPYPLLAAITGRSDAGFRTSDGGFASTVFLAHVVGGMYNEGTVRKFQLVQESLDRITVRLVPREGMEDQALARKSEIADRLRDALGAHIRVDFVLERDIEPTPTGKHLYTVSKIASEHPIGEDG